MTSHNHDSGMFKTGDLVIGSSDPGKSVYTATGARVNNSGVSIYGSPEDLLEKETFSFFGIFSSLNLNLCMLFKY
jgi:hypothetical protein